MKVNRQKENAFMIQKLSRNRLERPNTQSTLSEYEMLVVAVR